MRYKITTLKHNKMLTYSLWASSKLEAEQKACMRDGCKPLEVKESSWFARIYPISSQSIITSLYQLFLLLQAQTPIHKALDVVEKHCLNPKLSMIFSSIKQSLANGMSLPESFTPFRGVFGDLCIAMLQAGSKSGRLTECLKLLVEDLEEKHRERGAMIKAMSYPLFVMMATFVCFGVLLVFVVPQFVEMLSQNGVALPIYTKVLILLFEFVQSYGMICLGTFVGIGVGIGLELGKRSIIAQSLISFALTLPYIGKMLKLGYLKNYCFSLSILLRSGVPLLQAHSLAEEGVFSSALRAKLGKIKDALESGKTLSQGMRECGVFDMLSVSLVDVAQESGRVEEILELCSRQYQESISSSISKMIALIEPTLTLLLGAFILLLALGIFVPIWDMGF